MPGLLADVNVQGHLPYLKSLIDKLDLLDLLTNIDVEFVTFSDRGLDRRINDRMLWNFCQDNDLVLFTENRNHEDENSLNATMQDSWRVGLLPVLTLANKGTFENSRKYAVKVAVDVAEQLFMIFHEKVRNQSRIFVPLSVPQA